jgi:hypothetical protein
MPRDGSVTLADIREPHLTIVCGRCGRRGRLSVAKLMERHGDAKLTDLLREIADCPKERPRSLQGRVRGALIWQSRR